MGPLEQPFEDGRTAAWPERLRELGLRLRPAIAHDAAGPLVAEIWTLLNLALRRYVRSHGNRLGRLSAEDVSEIVDEKASELLRKIDSKDWNPADLPAAQLTGFLATVARNGVVDLLRTRRREVPTPADFDVPSANRAWGGPVAAQESAASGVDGARYAQAIVECSAGLSVRARRAWFLRILYEIGSADIARDPRVATTPAGVDAMLARCREHVRVCLARKGFTVGPLPPGTFVRLWEMTHEKGES